MKKNMKQLPAKLVFLTCFLLLLALASKPNTDFITEQKKYERVRIAFAEKGDVVTKALKKHSLNPNDIHILITAYKDSDEFDLYVKSKSDSRYAKLQSYVICMRSGQLGPKRKLGDLQVPEGFYHIDRFNPTSSFFLSLGINYPNAADRKKSNAPKLGGNIFIHGNCASIGCIPLEDEIKEIYLYALHAKNNGQEKIPVYIFPFRMTEENLKKHRAYPPEIQALWKNLQVGYDKFIKDPRELKVSTNAEGDYLFQ
jgi:murein L,D-transpeptidase YafK